MMLSLKQARRVVILVVGLTVLGIGLVMLVLPGPAVVVIPTGLAILGTEFLWARRLLKRIRRQAGSLVESTWVRRSGRPEPRDREKNGPGGSGQSGTGN